MDGQNQLKNKVQTWIEEQGYPLEMRVANTLIESGFEVRQSLFYIDPESDEAREIDVVGRSTEITDVVDISFVIECKSTSKPWVLFTSENTFVNYNQFFAYCLYSEAGRKRFCRRSTSIQKLGDFLTWFDKKGRNGYAVTEAFTSNVDNTYKAIMSTLKASIALKTLGDKEQRNPLIFIFPIIVVDGCLFESYLNNNGKLVVEEIEKGFLHFPRKIGKVTGTTVYVFTLNYLAQFIVEAKRVTAEIKELFADVNWDTYASED